MAYDSHGDAVWLVGYEILKLNRQGNVLFRQRVEGWCCASVSINPRDGSVWIAELEHPDTAKSKNRLWLLNSDGSVRHKTDLGAYGIFVVACDGTTGDAWIGSYNEGIRRVSPAGELGAPLEIKARNISLSPTTGDIWIATEEAVLRIDPAGKILARSPFRKASKQSWLAAF